MKYHINNEGNLGVCKSLQGKCPFGGASGSENHYATKEEAWAAFEEKNKEVLFKPLAKAAEAKKPAAGQSSPGAMLPSEEARRAAWGGSLVPPPGESKLIKPPTYGEGYRGSRSFRGGRVDEALAKTGRAYYTSEEVRTWTKEALKEALRAGELPTTLGGKELSYAVKKNTYGETMVTVGLKDGRRRLPMDLSLVEEVDAEGRRKPNKDGRELKRYLEDLTHQWGTDDSNMQVDYFNRAHRPMVEWRSRWD